jgi:hypothetical protein
MRVERWLSQWMREALDQRRDLEATTLLEATQDVRRVICDLLQSDEYGGRLKPETRRFWQAVTMLMGANRWITRRIAEARASGSSEIAELRAARGTIQAILSDLFDSRRRSTRDAEE